MDIIPYEEFRLNEGVLKNLRESYAVKKIREYFKTNGVLPSKEIVDSFVIPSELLERYKMHAYSQYYKDALDNTPEEKDTDYDKQFIGYRGRLHFKLDWTEPTKTVTVTETDEPAQKPNSSAKIWLYIGTAGNVGLYETSPNIFEITLDVNTDWGFLVRTSNTTWDGGTKYGAGQEETFITFGVPLALDTITAAEIILGDNLKRPLTLSIAERGNITLTPKSATSAITFEYKVNDSIWKLFNSTTANSFNLYVERDSIIRFRAPIDSDGYTKFDGVFSGSTAQFWAMGNIMSLLKGDGFDKETTLQGSGTFSNLFAGCNGLIDASQLLLPAEILTEDCYRGMFSRCSDLIVSPRILPAMTLAKTCYCQMFMRCIALENAPELPATTLAFGCYSGMFSGCYSLAYIPRLPATTLAEDCYCDMFEFCLSLKSTPDLPAALLLNNCYCGMFKGCESLNNIKCLATDISATNCTTDWVDGVSSSGTFIKASSMTGWTPGVSGIPNNWTVIDAN